MTLAIIASIVYLVYRGAFTLSFDGWFATTFSLTLYAAEAYGCALMALYFFQIWDLHDPDPVEPLPNRTVDIYIPTYNEDPDLLRGTITAALAVRYPHRTYVLDDGDRPEVRALCERLGADYIRRDSNLHAKAGNINHAMELTDGEFVIILDADHVAEAHFIDRTLGYFADEKLAFVQTPHAFYNYDSFQGVLNYGRGVYWEEGQLFYNCTQPGKNRWNAVSFCGSAAIFRRAALETVGLIATESITEDLHTGLRLHSKGWRSLFVNERLISGQAAPDIATFHSQRLRWGEGNLGVMFFDNPLTMKGLTLAQRACYIGSMLCWTTGVQKLVLYAAPILMLATGVAPVTELSRELALVTVCYLLSVWSGVKFASGGYGRLIAVEMTAMACFWTQVLSCWRATFGRAAAKFVVTNKRGGQGGSVLRQLRPQLVLIAAGAAAVAWAGGKIICGVSGDVTGFGIGAALILVQSLFALEIVRRGLKRGDQRFSWRHPLAAHLRWSVELPDGSRRTGTGVTCDLNEIGVGFLAFEALPSADLDQNTNEPVPAGPGSTVAVEITAAGRTLSAVGEIRHVTRLADERSTKGLSRAYRYGVRFDTASLDDGDLDAIWDLGAKYGVTRQYERFHTGAGLSGEPCAAPADGEAVINLPIDFRFVPDVTERRDGELCALEDAAELLTDGPAERTVTETLGPDTLCVLLPTPHAPGEWAEASLETPGGAAQAWCVVSEVRPAKVGGRTLHAHRFAFRKYAEEGRGVIGGLVHRADKPGLRESVRLTPHKTPAPVMRPLAAAGGAATLAAGLLLSAGLLVHRDDYLMTHVAEAGEARPDEVTRLHDLLADMRAVDEFDEPRVLRLRSAFTAIDDRDAVAGLNELLVTHSPETPMGRFRRAESLMNLNRYAEADEIFVDLLTEPHLFAEDRTRRELAVAAGRNAAHLKKWAAAAVRFEQYAAWGGELDPIRSEWAGLLAEAGRPDKAVRVLTAAGRRGPDAMSADDRHLLAPLQLALGDGPGAAETYRSLLKDDPQDSAAGLGLARVALDTGEAGATEAFRLFLAEHPGDSDARLGLAQSLLAEGEPLAAEQTLRELLVEEPDHPDLWPSYLSILDELRLAAADTGAIGNDAVREEFAASAVERRQAVRAIAAHRDSRAEDGPFLLQLIGAVRDAAADDRPGSWDGLLDEIRTDFVALPGATPTERLRRAEALADLGRDAEAAGALTELAKELAADPLALPDAADRRSFHLAAARADVRAGRWERADRRFADAVSEGVAPATIRGERAGVLARLDRPAEAAALLALGTMYEHGDPFAPMDAQPVSLARTAEGGTGNATDDAASAPPLTVAEAVQLGGLWAAAGDLGAAADVLADVLAHSPTHLEATRLLADVSAGRQRFADAARLYARVVELNPAADRAAGDAAATQAAYNRLWSGDAAGAEAAFRGLLAADFGRVELWTPYLEAAGGTGALPPAAGPLVDALYARRAERSGDDRFLSALVAAVHRGGRPDRVVSLLRVLTEKEGTPRELLIWLADSLQQQGRHDEAARIYDRLLREAPTRTGAFAPVGVRRR